MIYPNMILWPIRSWSEYQSDCSRFSPQPQMWQSKPWPKWHISVCTPGMTKSHHHLVVKSYDQCNQNHDLVSLSMSRSTVAHDLSHDLSQDSSHGPFHGISRWPTVRVSRYISGDLAHDLRSALFPDPSHELSHSQHREGGEPVCAIYTLPWSTFIWCDNISHVSHLSHNLSYDMSHEASRYLSHDLHHDIFGNIPYDLSIILSDHTSDHLSPWCSISWLLHDPSNHDLIIYVTIHHLIYLVIYPGDISSSQSRTRPVCCLMIYLMVYLTICLTIYLSDDISSELPGDQFDLNCREHV